MRYASKISSNSSRIYDKLKCTKMQTIRLETRRLENKKKTHRSAKQIKSFGFMKIR